ncbi:hypothetical protein [Dubosiella newyorkensis]|uniref:hypothetical protein n=1 Tax=Dubosiella newyorkensis TaxID=1862672 RepID=UPI00272E9350|nr:hypothetical protein [Dubosiella newyorkensis]
MAKAINLDGLKTFYQKLKQWITTQLNSKVDKVNGKGLSTNDLTDELLQKLQNAGDSSFSGNYDDLTNKPGAATQSAPGFMSAADKTKLDGIQTGAQANIIETIKVNGAAVAPTAKAVSLTIPTKMSQLLNDGSFATTSDVTTAVANAVSGKLQREFVNTLPATLQDNVIYSVPKQTGTGQTSNVRIEYMKGPDGSPEIVGDTKVDLTGYWKEDWASAADIDAVVFGE